MYKKFLDKKKCSPVEGIRLTRANKSLNVHRDTTYLIIITNFMTKRTNYHIFVCLFVCLFVYLEKNHIHRHTQWLYAHR